MKRIRLSPYFREGDIQLRGLRVVVGMTNLSGQLCGGKHRMRDFPDLSQAAALERTR
jgi:hypothetical protein